MQRIRILVSVILALLVSAPFATAGNVTLMTYYAAPQGAFDRIRLIPSGTALEVPCEIGSLATDPTSNALEYCWDDGLGNGSWGALNNTWTRNGDHVFPTDTAINPDIYLAIGTDTAEFKLTLESDGGILASGTLGSGRFLSDYTGLSEARLIWYPRKAAFRAGVAADSSWNDANIGINSISLGGGIVASGISSVGVGGPILGSDFDLASGNYSTLFSPHLWLGMRTSTAIGSHSTLVNLTFMPLSISECNSQHCVNISTTVGNSSTGQYSVSAGYGMNYANNTGATILGGSYNNSGGTIAGQHSTILSGYNHKSSNTYTTVLGGFENTASGVNAAVHGGYRNIASGGNATIGGGRQNIASGASSTVTGGYNNQATATGALVTGGTVNRATADYSAVLGGNTNTASGAYSIVAGGQFNTASGAYSVVAGGERNTNAGDYSFAGGRFMNLTAAADRTFVWGHSAAALTIAASDSFIIASGKVGIHQMTIGATDPILNIRDAGTDDYLAVTRNVSGDVFIVKNNSYIGVGKNNPTHPLEFGAALGGAHLTAGGSFVTVSSREVKKNIEDMALQDALNTLRELRPVKYNYKVEKDDVHLGFIADDAPDMVADPLHHSVDAMAVAAVLTTVMKDNEQKIDRGQAGLEELRTTIKRLEQSFNTQ